MCCAVAAAALALMGLSSPANGAWGAAQRVAAATINVLVGQGNVVQGGSLRDLVLALYAEEGASVPDPKDIDCHPSKQLMAQYAWGAGDGATIVDHLF